MTLLHIGGGATVAVSARPQDAPSIIRIPIGFAAAGRLPIRHDPPTPLELENAIETVENEVMPLVERLPWPSMLVGAGASIESIARASGRLGPGEISLPLEEVETLFQQLAAVSQGRPAASSGLPPGIPFAVTLLILREFMYHLGFVSISVEAAEPDEAARC